MTTPRTRTKTSQSSNSATTGYETQLWQMADALRGSMDAAEWSEQQAEAARFDAQIATNLTRVGFGPNREDTR